MPNLGIEAIAAYIPSQRISNYDLKEKFAIDNTFIEQKIGVKERAIKDTDDNTSDLCIKAFKQLENKTHLKKADIDCCIVVTQNPDKQIPHTSAIVHGKLDLSEQCASFDISLGCSGYVYALSVITSFMQQNGLKKGLLFTADPYSKIVNTDDKNTALLFGDAASVTLISEQSHFVSGHSTFGTIGKEGEKLTSDNELFMNGRAIFNFAAKYIPKDIFSLLEKNSITDNDVDLYIFHQGSKYIIDTLTKRMKLDHKKVPYDIINYGNTVSSSIPILLEKQLENKSINNIIISGFGVGLSWSSSLLKRS